jgi:hypothetical protein
LIEIVPQSLLPLKFSGTGKPFGMEHHLPRS